MKVFKMLGSALTKAEAMALINSAKRLPPNPIIIQIGAWKGTSTVAMLEARPDAFIFSVDIKPWPDERENLIKFGLDHTRVFRVLGDSKQMSWPDKIKADMLYVDGDHRYNGIKADCETWVKTVKSGGLILFHDYIPLRPPPKNQVAKAIDEFFAGRKPFIRAERVIGFVKE